MKKPLSLFKALSDRNRLRIVAALFAHDELCACQLTEVLQIAGASASRHLSQLVSSGILDSRKDGRWVNYRLREPAPEDRSLLQWLMAELEASHEIQKDRQSLQKIVSQDREEICRKQRGETCCPQTKH